MFVSTSWRAKPKKKEFKTELEKVIRDILADICKLAKLFNPHHSSTGYAANIMLYVPSEGLEKGVLNLLEEEVKFMAANQGFDGLHGVLRLIRKSFLKDRDTIDAIVSLFIEQLFIGTQGVFGVTTAAWDAILKNVLADWDLLASALNEVSFPLSTRGDQLLVAMRLLLPEIASRASIALCFKQLSLGVGAERITYIDERWFSKEIIGYFIEWFKAEDELIADQTCPHRSKSCKARYHPLASSSATHVQHVDGARWR